MRQHLLRQPAEFTAGIRVHDGPKTGNRRRLPRAHRSRSSRRGPAKAIRQAPEAMQPKSGGGNRRKGDRQPKSGAEPTARQLTAENRAGKVASKAIRSQKSGAETAAKRLTTKNRTNKSRCKGDRQPKSGAETTARQLTTGNRAGKVAARRLTAGNRSAETIDNRKSGRRELPETAAARPLRRISRDGPRRRTPLPT